MVKKVVKKKTSKKSNDLTDSLGLGALDKTLTDAMKNLNGTINISINLQGPEMPVSPGKKKVKKKSARKR